jgi:hypothetical protein
MGGMNPGCLQGVKSKLICTCRQLATGSGQFEYEITVSCYRAGDGNQFCFFFFFIRPRLLINDSLSVSSQSLWKEV